MCQYACTESISAFYQLFHNVWARSELDDSYDKGISLLSPSLSLSSKITSDMNSFCFFFFDRGVCIAPSFALMTVSD